MKTDMNFEQEIFRKPPAEFGVIYSWVWNDLLSKSEIENQIESFQKAGIEVLYILPEPKEFRPGRMNTKLAPAYLSDSFMEYVIYAYKCAEKHGIELWLYDEGGWPSGGACSLTAKVNPNADCIIFRRYNEVLKAGCPLKLAQNDIAAFCGKKRLEVGFSFSEDTCISIYRMDKLSGNPNMVNLLDKSVTETFLSVTHEKYKHYLGNNFGNHILNFFTDEPHCPRQVWHPKMEKLFFNQYGYSVSDYIYCLCADVVPETEQERKAKIDYGRLIGSLFCQNYFLPLQGWCHKNKMQLVGHLDVDHIIEGNINAGYFSNLSLLRQFDIPGVDAIARQIFMPSEEKEPVPEGIPFYPRIASSAAAQSGHNLSLTESFAVYGNGMTMDEMRYVLNYQAIRGINVFNVMTISYGKNGVLPIQMRPSFGSEKNGFTHMKHWNLYFKRLSYLLCLGKRECCTALYYPLCDVWAGGIAQQKASASFIALGTQLENAHIDFDLIDDEGILNATVTDAGILLGSCVYERIALCNTDYIPKECYNKIKPFLWECPATQKTPLRKLIRTLSKNCRLEFWFNESEKNVSSALDYNQNMYRLDILNGKVLPYQGERFSVYPGDITAFLIGTPESFVIPEYSTVTATFDVPLKLTNATQYTVSENGILQTKVSPQKVKGNLFCGEAVLEGEYDIDNADCTACQCVLELPLEKMSAEIFFNDISVGSMGLSPQKLCIDFSAIASKGKIKVRLSNTLSNALIQAKGLLSAVPMDDMGGYHDMVAEFENPICFQLPDQIRITCLQTIH